MGQNLVILIKNFFTDLELRYVCHRMEQERGFTSGSSFETLEAIYNSVFGLFHQLQIGVDFAQQGPRILLRQHEFYQNF